MRTFLMVLIAIILIDIVVICLLYRSKRNVVDDEELMSGVEIHKQALLDKLKYCKLELEQIESDYREDYTKAKNDDERKKVQICYEIDKDKIIKKLDAIESEINEI